jgi:hypothetical protein
VDHPADIPRATLLVRSLGMMVLRHLVWERHGLKAEGRFTQQAFDEKLFDVFQSVVLSAPVLDIEFHGPTLEKFGVPVFVMLNTKDKVLGLTRFFSIHALGNHRPIAGDKKAEPGRNVKYLDCTDFPSIGDRHSYLLTRLNEDVTQAHVQVLTGHWKPEDLGGWAKVAGVEIWCKKP